MKRFFGNASGFVDMVSKFVPSPKAGAAVKIDHIYSGAASSECALAMKVPRPRPASPEFRSPAWLALLLSSPADLASRCSLRSTIYILHSIETCPPRPSRSIFDV